MCAGRPYIFVRKFRWTGFQATILPWRRSTGTPSIRAYPAVLAYHLDVTMRQQRCAILWLMLVVIVVVYIASSMYQSFLLLLLLLFSAGSLPATVGRQQQQYLPFLPYRTHNVVCCGCDMCGKYSSSTCRINRS